MNMGWFSSILYGIVSGFTEFLPISSSAHQDIFMLLFGVETRDPVRDLFVHIAIAFSLYWSLKPMFDQLRREGTQSYSRRNSFITSAKSRYDLRLIRSATLPLLIVLIVLSYVFGVLKGNLLATAGLFLLNGIILFVPGRMMQGNKDSRMMTQMDGVLIGLFGGLGALNGVSSVGCLTSVSIARGAGRQQALNWAFALGLPMLITLSGLDFVQAVFGGVSIPFWQSFFTYILSAAGAYFGGYFSIMLARLLIVRMGFSGFAYYSWGASLLTFILYLYAV